jgi:hypothetical protein
MIDILCNTFDSNSDFGIFKLHPSQQHSVVEVQDVVVVVVVIVVVVVVVHCCRQISNLPKFVGK